IDLVLLDMIMPRVGGHEAFSKIRRIDPDANILLSSGFVSGDEVSDLLAKGARGFLPKPHRIPEIAAEIRRILDTWPRRTPAKNPR
ncbi:MAG: response regulator, partial [Victivallaceae bacterium]|nr:response regulator [Victivallaceae bacterium]